MTIDNSSREATDAATFEQQLASLEVIVQELEEGQIGLADALARYEQGIKLLKECYQTLQGAERKIELLSRVTLEGTPVTQPLDDASESLDEKSQRRSQRRSRPADTRAADPPLPPPAADAVILGEQLTRSANKGPRNSPPADDPDTDAEIDVPGGLF